MRVLFVVRDIYLFERFGIMHISSMLKSGGHIIDIARSLSEDIDAKVASFKPDVIAYSVTTGFHHYYLGVNREIRKRHDALSVFGGPHPTFFPEIIKEEGVDVVCIGEGERPMLELADALSAGKSIENIENLIVKTKSGIKENPARRLVEDLDELPFPDRGLVYDKSAAFRDMKVKAFFSGRGCPYQCTYCFNHKFNELFRNKGKIIRKRSVDNLLSEIKQVRSRYPLEVVRFMDDVFILGGRSWLEEFAVKYRKEIGLPFVCMARADLIDEGVVKLLKDAGCCSVYMAIEAANDRIRNELLKRNLKRDRMVQSIRLFHDHGIKVVAENILGLPSETIEDMLDTLKLNIQCRIDLAIASIFTPYPGTELAEYAKENGYFTGDYDKIDYSFFEDSPLNFTPSEKKKIRNLSSLFNFTVSFPMLLPLVKVLINIPSNRVFKFIGEMWHGYCLKFRIFPHPMTFRENLRMVSLFFKRNEE